MAAHSVVSPPPTGRTLPRVLAVLPLLGALVLGQTVDPSSGLPLIYASPRDPAVLSSSFDFTDPGAFTAHEDGVLELSGESKYEPSVRSPKAIAWLKHPAVGSFVLEAELMQTGRDYGHRDLCLFFGRQDASHFYYVHLASKADPHAHNIFLVDGAPRRSIAKKTTQGIDWGRDVYKSVRVERDAQKGTIAVFFEDLSTPIMEAKDTTFGVGRLGFGSFDDTGRFRNVRVYGKVTPFTELEVEVKSASVTVTGVAPYALTSSPDERWRIEQQTGIVPGETHPADVVTTEAKYQPVFGLVADFDPAHPFETSRTFDHLYSTSGIRITKGAHGEPFPHHRGVMAGWSKTGVGGATYDFWHCKNVTIRHLDFDASALQVVDDALHVRSRSEWIAPDGKPVIRERRDVTIKDLTDVGLPTRLYDYLVTLTPLTDGPIVLKGDPQHAGFQLRMAEEVATREKETVYVRSSLAHLSNNDVWHDCEWVAGRFTVEGKVIWALHVSGKSLPRPLVYSTRSYGRFGAFFETTLEKATARAFPFRIAIIEGDIDRQALTRLATTLLEK